MKTFAVVLVVMAIVMLAFTGCTHVVTEGSKVGTVIKLSQQGIVCKTWEGELLRGGMQGGSGGFSTTPLHFTVNDSGLLKATQDALEGQYEVDVKYVEYFGPMDCSSNSAATFLTSIRRR